MDIASWALDLVRLIGKTEIMTAGVYDLPIETNTFFEHTFFWADDIDPVTYQLINPYDLTGFNAKLEMASDYFGNPDRIVFYTLSTTVSSTGAGIIITPENGQIDLAIPYLDCIQFNFDAVYDLLLIANDDPNYVWKFIKGAILLDRGVTTL